MTADSLPQDREPVLRVSPQPADTNIAGDIFGGWIMSQVDIAGAITAARRAKGRVVTVAVNAFTFEQPVYMGDLVSFYADITRVGTTSVTVDVTVYAERGLKSDEPYGRCVKVTEAVLTYVSIDAHRRPRPVDAQ